MNYKLNTVNSSLYNVWAVIDYPLLFKSDIEQCADWCMRFWAEYHLKANKLNELFLFDYSGNKKFFSSTGVTFKKFLSQNFSYANSYSLKKGCQTIQSPSELKPGDMFVQNTDGSIGHISMVIDVCKDNEGEHYFLIRFSFMPPQVSY